MKCEWLSLCGGWELTTAIGQLGISSVCHVHLFLPIYIRIPEGDSLKEAVRQFQSNYNFPQCICTIDGSHIPIVALSEFPADYYNWKGWHSVILQALVDHEYRFMHLSRLSRKGT